MQWRLVFGGLALCLWAVQPRSLWQGAVLLADHYEARIVGSSADRWHAPDGLIADGEGFYLADEGGSTVWQWRPGLLPRRLISAGEAPQSPEDIVRDADGNVFFTDDEVGGVWQITPAGKLKLLAGPAEGLVSTEGLALLPDGSLLVGEGSSHKLFRVSRRGAVEEISLSSPIIKAESITCDPKGTIYIADDTLHTVFRVSHAGEVTVLIDSRDGLQTCESICWFDGGLYITDDKASKLYRWSDDTGLVTLAQFAGRLKNVQGVAVGSDGAIYVSVQTSLSSREGFIVAIVPVTQ